MRIVQESLSMHARNTSQRSVFEALKRLSDSLGRVHSCRPVLSFRLGGTRRAGKLLLFPFLFLLRRMTNCKSLGKNWWIRRVLGDVYIYSFRKLASSWTFRCFVAATTRGIDSSARRSCGAPPTFGGTGPRSKLVNPPSWRFETCGKATRVFTDAESIFATRRPETSRSTSPSSVSLANSSVKSLNFRGLKRCNYFKI